MLQSEPSCLILVGPRKWTPEGIKQATSFCHNRTKINEYRPKQGPLVHIHASMCFIWLFLSNLHFNPWCYIPILGWCARKPAKTIQTNGNFWHFQITGHFCDRSTAQCHTGLHVIRQLGNKFWHESKDGHVSVLYSIWAYKHVPIFWKGEWQIQKLTSMLSFKHFNFYHILS